MARKSSTKSGDLFIGESGQLRMLDKSAEQRTMDTRKVECLGMTFASDEERRKHFLEKLKEQLKDPEFRKTPGFPKGSDEDILRLSDPPYYTACPNPFLGYLFRNEPRPPYEREPLAVDLSEGKNDHVFDAHPYHTKVPPRTLVRLLLHYTSPGDVVLDPFAGSGMLGVAAAQCASRTHAPDLTDGERGARTAILSDLSPSATFIGNVNANSTLPLETFSSAAQAVSDNVENDLGWLYEVEHTKAAAKGASPVVGELLYTIWTEYYWCPDCQHEISAWDAIVDRKAQVIRAEFPCPQCHSKLKKSQLERVKESCFDPVLRQNATRTKRRPVWLHYKVGTKRHERAVLPSDLAILERADCRIREIAPPTERMMFREAPWGDFYRSGYHQGVTHVHHFFTERNYLVLWSLRCAALASPYPREMLYVLTAFLDNHASRRNRYLVDPHHPMGTTCGPLPNSLYIPELQCEVNPFHVWAKTVNKQCKLFGTKPSRAAYISTESSRLKSLPDASVDYIFADPPFGSNILYAESSFLWEHFIGVYTAQLEEAIISQYQGKDLERYRGLIEQVFRQCYRVLRPGRWMTIEFSNRSNAVWNAISEAIWGSGFVVADVRVFDKKQGTIRQDLGQSMNMDLMISCYKPSAVAERSVVPQPKDQSSAWAFVNEHLRHVPVFVGRGGRAEVIAERLPRMLHDRMVAFHVQRGMPVPLGAPEFLRGVEQRYPERDGMLFLPEQVAAYDRKRTAIVELQQLSLFVVDEASAIQWARQQLAVKPQSFQELQPTFMRELHGWAKHERTIELQKVLDESFLRFDGKGPVPSQIHAYLSTNFKDCRNLAKNDPSLVSKARDRWYVPDPSKQADLEKLREKALLREFGEYVESKQRKLKQFRTEAVRAGFKAAYDSGDYKTIIAVAAKLPEAVLQEDEKLLMYFDVASMRLGEE